jgi:hypothetical protein
VLLDVVDAMHPFLPLINDEERRELKSLVAVETATDVEIVELPFRQKSTS